MQDVLTAFGLSNASYEPFGTGLINHTWKIYTSGGNFILQKINENVFKRPQDIAYNIRLVADYLGSKNSDYLFVAPLTAVDGTDLICLEGKGWFRLTHFIEGSSTFDVVQTPGHAYEAAKQFGRFTSILSGFDASQLKETIPHFHDLELRYRQFVNALNESDEQRRTASKDIIKQLLEQKGIVNEYHGIINNPQFRRRVTHHDAKISNVLFDKHNKGICVIDLDTIMPGYFISDVGDMMRTYLCPVSEEEKDLDKIIVRDEFYNAIVEGYSREMKDKLTATERNYFLFAGKIMIYMQALRFLTDYLNRDVYYGAKYEGHNLVRAKNQATLLQRLTQMEVTT